VYWYIPWAKLAAVLMSPRMDAGSAMTADRSSGQVQKLSYIGICNREESMDLQFILYSCLRSCSFLSHVFRLEY
jgi:hypothetical protein